MTRSSKLALVTLLAGLLSLVPITGVTADSGCSGYAQEHCEEMSAANNPALFRITEIAPPVHLLSATGIGQEHFEAMSVEQPNVFITPAGPSAAPSGVGLDRSPAGYDAIPQAKSQAEMKLLENNTTNLPNAIAQGDLPISGSQPQIPVDVNAARRPSGADAASPAQISGQRRLLEMNTTMLAQDDPVYPYAEAVTPHIGRPR